MTVHQIFSRRQFLRRSSAILGAAAAAPLVVPATALGGGAARAPGERITMGFIGLGNQATGHLLGGAWTYLTGGYVARPDVQVLAVCDVRRERRQQICDRVNQYYAGKFQQGTHKSCVGYNDFRELLARDDIDAVLIGTPIHWHGPMTILAAKAGKDVYCEKPCTLTIAEGQDMVEAVRRYGRVYQAGTQQRSEYGGKFRQACEFVRSGRIGQLKKVYAYRDGGGYAPEAGFGKPVAEPAGFDWDLWLGPIPWRPYAGRAHAHLFGDGGINWGQHHFDIVQWGLGTDDTGPVEIYRENGMQAFRYANGVVVYGGGYPGESVGGSGGACFVGTEGRIAVDRGQLVAHPANIIEKPLGPDEVQLYNANSHSGNFLECIRTRKPTICDVETSHRAMSVLLLGGIAKRFGRPLKWDPVKEEFPGDDEANRMRSYAWREPWRA